MRLRLSLFILVYAAFSTVTIAQLQNRAFISDSYTNYLPKVREVKLGIQAMGFGKNNEYFNDIADGYTLFGYQFNPELTYRPLPELTLQAGVFLRKDFGNDGYQKIAPTFTFTYQKDSFEIIFGNIRGSLDHRLIEPLYDFERIITDRLEYGLQYRLRNNGYFVDTWVNWERMLYAGDSEGEVISGGVSSHFPLWKNQQWTLDAPAQFVVRHSGGQIDNDPRPLSTYTNTALGLRLRKELDKDGFFRYVRAQPYFVYYRDISNQYVLPFKEGQGLYLNTTIGMRPFDLMLSYWNAEDFIAFQGGPVYQSVSSTYFNPDAIAPHRHLLIIRAMRDIRFSEEFFITLRLEPIIDLETKQVDYSFGFYLNFRQSLLLAKLKPQPSDETLGQ